MLEESLEVRARAAVEAFKSPTEYTNTLVEQFSEDYAEGYCNAKKNIGVTYPELDLSYFLLEDKDDTPKDSPTHSVAGV